ncbi:MAG TPA: hypothetical protein VGK02_02425 [Candidatus Aquicultor sp.]|jgi:L-threonine kinase
MKATIAMPGSCGELVQGIIDSHDIHITCPINRFSIAHVRVKPRGGLQAPAGLNKTADAVTKALELIGTVNSAEIEISSDLPHGKGMASSTADIGAALSALYMACERTVTERELAQIALAVEPTDGTLFSGIFAFDHINGEVCERISDAPPIDVIVLEPTAIVDTVTFNRAKETPMLDTYIVREAYEMAVVGLQSLDIKLIGEAATISAVANQAILPKRDLQDVIDATKRRGALGVNVAHSGTVMGILAERGYAGRLLDKIAYLVPRTWDAYVVSVINGGAREATADPVVVNKT